MAKQTPYRFSADAIEIFQNTHDFCKREKENGLKISMNQAKERALTATEVSKSMARRKGDRTETAAYQPPVIQSIVSQTSSLRRQLVK